MQGVAVIQVIGGSDVAVIKGVAVIAVIDRNCVAVIHYPPDWAVAVTSGPLIHDDDVTTPPFHMRGKAGRIGTPCASTTPTQRHFL